MSDSPQRCFSSGAEPASPCTEFLLTSEHHAIDTDGGLGNAEFAEEPQRPMGA